MIKSDLKSTLKDVAGFGLVPDGVQMMELYILLKQMAQDPTFDCRYLQ